MYNTLLKYYKVIINKNSQLWIFVVLQKCWIMHYIRHQ